MLSGYGIVRLSLRRVSIACYAECCTTYDTFRLSVCLSVCHSPVSCENNPSYDNAVITGG